MAPEILRREKYNEMVDVYAYAMCLLELLSCRLPWHGKGGTAEVHDDPTALPPMYLPCHALDHQHTHARHKSCVGPVRQQQ